MIGLKEGKNLMVKLLRQIDKIEVAYKNFKPQFIPKGIVVYKTSRLPPKNLYLSYFLVFAKSKKNCRVKKRDGCEMFLKYLSLLLVVGQKGIEMRH